MKTILLCLAAVLFSHVAFSQQPTPAKTIITEYQKQIKLNPKVKPEDVYAMAENWFNANPALFSTKNTEAPEPAKLKNKKAVEEAYDNHHPLQTLDPAAYRVLGQGIVKYFGGSNTSIRMLYIKYDVSIQAGVGEIIFKVYNVRYFHFDPKNYTEAGIFAFKGGQPCDYTGMVEYLKGCHVSEPEFTALTNFFNSTITNLFGAFNKEVKDNKMLPVPAATTAKAPAKKTTKSNTKKTAPVTTAKAATKK